MKEEADNYSPDPRLTPVNHSFSDKNKLKKSVSDIPLSQVEYLSVAFLENDLTAEQIAELEENLLLNPENRKIFESIQKTRLTPTAVTYNFKSLSRRPPAINKILRIAAVSLSTAATIAILITSIVFGPGLMNRNNAETAELIIDTLPVTFLIAANNPVRVNAGQRFPESHINPGGSITENISIIDTKTYTEPEFVIREMPSSFSVNIPEPGRIADSETLSSIVASKARSIPVITYDDRGPVRKFIASTFRQKILREEYFTDEKLKPYEVAKAGIEGINRLLDWEMRLTENIDEAGLVNSLNFSSTLISFNAPVKKTVE